VRDQRTDSSRPEKGELMSDDRPILDGFNLVVTDMASSVAFYRRLGLDIPDTEPDWQLRHRTATSPGGIDLDLDSVEFARQWDQGWTDRQRMGVLGFKVTSREAVDDIYDDLASAGYNAQQPPYDAFWGARYAIVEDPDGNAVGIMSPVDPKRRGGAPEP
jgi:catechol 2,3-dioxygenase-like lactoylglutathione lyase family enzyme